MICINPNDKEFKKRNKGNPLLAEVAYKGQIQELSQVIQKPFSDLGEGIEWLKKVMPDAPIEIIDGLVDGVANGSFDTLEDLIRLSRNYADKRSVYHEAFHRAFELLPEQEKEDLLNEGAKKFGIARGKSTATRKYQKVDYVLKAVDILNSDKAKQVFDKGKKNGWDLDKILTELAIPKEQKQLILDISIGEFYDDLSLNENLALNLSLQYSYAVEIKTSTENLEAARIASREGLDYEDTLMYFKSEETTPTKYYANLTVPGGTNYTEQEISTPLIIPSIKGHAQFATDKGIGWFRSDAQTKQGTFKNLNKEFWDSKYNEYMRQGLSTAIAANRADIDVSRKGVKTIGKPTKIRRILEVQSDLFQKGRGNENIIKLEKPMVEIILDGEIREMNDVIEFNERILQRKKDLEFFKEMKEEEFNDMRDAGASFSVGLKSTWKEQTNWIEEEILQATIKLKEFENFLNNTKTNSDGKNQFLQLLNKDSNWVTFFIKSILQDSAKLGYEKVLFPTGNTASRVEGHTTLEEFRKEKERRINKLEELRENVGDEFFNDGYKFSKYNNRYFMENLETEQENEISPEEYKENKSSIHAFEIMQLKQELENVERNGFGALKPIWNFYENTVFNILKKQGLNPNLITDEYGNTWQEIDLGKINALENVRLQSNQYEYTGDLAIEEKMAEYSETRLGEPKNKFERMLKKILDFIKSLGKKSSKLDDLIKRINTGKIRKLDPQSFNIIFEPSPLLDDKAVNNIDLSNEKSYSLIRNISSLSVNDFMAEAGSIAKIINVDKENNSFDFILLSDLNNIERTNYDYYERFFASGDHKIKTATKSEIKKFNNAQKLLNAIDDKNKKVADSTKAMDRIIKNLFGVSYAENIALTNYLKSTSTINVLDILSVIENTDNHFGNLAGLIKSVITKNNYEITVSNEKEIDGIAGSYQSGKIEMNIRISSPEYTRVLLHELLHAISDNNQFQDEIDPLYKYVMKFFKDNDIDYGFKNNKEFLAEIFTNRTFQELMAKMEYPSETRVLSVLDKLLELLSSFFKIEKNSVLTEAFFVFEKISAYSNLNTKKEEQGPLWSKTIFPNSLLLEDKAVDLCAIKSSFNTNNNIPF